MSRRDVTASLVASLVVLVPCAARAQSAVDVRQAETLFMDAKHLRDSGKLEEACAKFAESKQRAPGVGVTLYLADCYERMGRTASALAQFRDAETLAHDRKDGKRAEVARAHAATLESKVNRVVVVVSPATVKPGAELRVDDGGAVPQEAWKTGIAVDPGDHVITLDAPGEQARTAAAHVDTATRTVTVTIADPTPPVAPVASPIAPSSQLPPESTASSNPKTREWLEGGLIGAGLVGVGVGAALLASKNQSMSNDGPGGVPQVDSGAASGSAVAFSIAGAAFVSAVVVYLTAPASKESAVRVTPAPMVGGGGAFLRASF